MALTVVVRSGDLKSPATITFDAPRIVIGRGDGCEVRLPDPSVSHRHASIRQRGTDYVIIDEGSTNGTFVGPVRLSPHAPRMLRANDTLRIGRIWIEVRIETALVTQNAPLATKEIALALVAAALTAQGERAAARVFVTEGPDAGKEILLSEFDRAYVIGRDPKSDLPINDVDASRRHAEIFRKGQHVYVRDLGSKNGTLLDGKRIDTGKEVIWPIAATLSIGADGFGYEDPVNATLSELEASSDEKMRDDESVDPPPSVGIAPNSAKNSRSDTAAQGANPAANASLSASRSNVQITKSTLRKADLLIGLLALTVLGISLFGLFWLFRVE
jgi:pSer/pThr/pTyr-binding forkhead associated (FHA) protein